MNKILVLIFFFMFSCTSNKEVKNSNFSDEMNFDQFKLELDEYVKNKPFPNMND